MDDIDLLEPCYQSTQAELDEFAQDYYNYYGADVPDAEE